MTQEEKLLEQYTTTKPTDRVKRLREYYLKNTERDELVHRIEIDLAIERAMKNSEGEPMELRRGKAFAAAAAAMPTEIFPEEPFVGWFSGSPDSMPLCAEQMGARLELELDHYKYISEEDKQIVRDEIIPYWKGSGDWQRHWFYQNYKGLPPATREMLYGDADQDLKKLPIITKTICGNMPYVDIGENPLKPEGLGLGLITDSMTRQHIGHCSFGYRKILKKGFLGVKRDAENRLSRIDRSRPADAAKVPFLEGVILAMDAAASVGQKFRQALEAAAKEETNAVRREELIQMAEVCARVPANPATTFREALQSVWFVHILNWYETPYTGAVSPGRIDQYLYPYYKSDMDAGRITKEKAQELLDCWLMRFSQSASSYLPLTSISHHVDIGGLDADGNDATNELSFMVLEGMFHTRLLEPNLCVLVHSKTPDDFLLKACQLCSMGYGYPAFLNNDLFVENFLRRGTLGGPSVPIELARTSCAIGCNEPHVTDYDSEFTQGSSIVLPKVLELALNDGYSWIHRKYMGPRTGKATLFKTFDQLRTAYLVQLNYMIEQCGIAIRNSERALADGYPTIYASALIEDCIEKGITREKGGARFNFGPTIAAIGATDTGDSLAAIKKCVYDDKSVSMSELMLALKLNFKGFRGVQRKLLDAPKFGNDLDYADEQVAWVLKTYCDAVVKQTNTRGGHLLPYQNALGYYALLGKMVWALPSGRPAFEPLADSASPERGKDVNGPTAVLNSMGKLDNAGMFFGQTLNMRLNKELFGTEEGIQKFAALVRTLVDLKIHHCQFNLVSSEVMRDAQQHPENHKELTVRVAGYMAYFTRLDHELQDTIIARTEH